MKRLDRDILALCEEVITFSDGPVAVSLAVHIKKRLAKPTRSARAKEYRRARVAKMTGQRAARNATTSDVRANVWARSAGRCEACGIMMGMGANRGHMDHFFGGSKRTSETTIEGCWRLCITCDGRKTCNVPSRRAWLLLYETHCKAHGYQAQAEKVAGAIALELAQHP